MKFLWSFFLAIIFLFFSISPTLAITLFEDNFDQGLTKWTPVRDDGLLWEIQDQRLYTIINTQSTITELVPKDQYWDDEWHDLEYEFDYLPKQGEDKNFSFGWRDLNNWYEFHLHPNGIILSKVKNTQVVFSHFEPEIIFNKQTYHIKIIFNQGQIKLFIDNLLVMDVADPTFDSENDYGKIGIKATAGQATPTEIFFDNIKVSTISSLNHLKQNDPLWANQIYDSADNWSKKPTIARWGCALTSIAMILDYHGIDVLPGEQIIEETVPLSPSTLNDWLKSQTDGYIGEGLLNWQAITRLTRLVNQIKGTPKLEYSRIGGNSFIPAINEIKNNKPVILQIDGHFLAADGFTEDESDLLIKDPAYTYTHFSDHQTELISTRKFEPSFTDLSYILITAPPEIQLEITDQNQQTITNIESFNEKIRDPFDNSGETTSEYQIYQIPKPEDSTIQINISQENHTHFDLQIFAYDTIGNVEDLTQNGFVGSEPTQLQIDFDKEQATLSQITNPQISWEELQLIISDLHQKEMAFSTPVFSQLDLLVFCAADQTQISNQLRYITLFENYLQHFEEQGKIDQKVVDYLSTQLDFLKINLNSSSQTP